SRTLGQTSNCCRPCSSDFFLAVSIAPEDAIVWSGGSFAEIRIHVLPDQVAVAGNLEEAAEVAFADERVPVGQPLGIRNSRTEEVAFSSLLILPNDLLGWQIDLDDARKRHRMV